MLLQPLFTRLRPVTVLKKDGRRRHAIEYLREFITLDTETSHNHNEETPLSWIYEWAAAFNEEIAHGRTPGEIIALFNQLTEYYGLTPEKRIVCYVHNLSYDITYLYRYLYEEYNGDVDILAIKSHKILTFRAGGIELRCSYLLANMGLDTWGKKLEIEHKKRSGTVDYNIIRYQDTPLTDNDVLYQIYDVIALHECIKKEMSINHDTVASIPLTSTGFVRRDCRRACTADTDYKKMFRRTRLDAEQFRLCNNAFMGGLCVLNRHYAGRTISGVRHRDYKSHYPSRQQLNYFPVGAFELYYDASEGDQIDIKDLIELLQSSCVLCEVAFENLRLHRSETLPYISSSKILNDYNVKFYTENGARGTCNGRVIDAVGTCLMDLTEIDLYWILHQYDYDDIIINKVYVSERGRIPEVLLAVINNYFTIKESYPDGILRDKSKNKLNGIYGMSATDPVRDEWVWDMETGEFNATYKTTEEVQAALDSYYNNRNSFMPYQWGIWTTAHARNELMVLYKAIGEKNFIYCDTDSIFYIDVPGVLEKIERYNTKVIEQNKRLGLGVVNRKNTISYYGTFEPEHDNRAIIFRGLHAKCYAYIDEGNLYVTIAGVSKKGKNGTSAQELGSIDNLRDGFIFTDCGGTRADYTSDFSPREIVLNGHRIQTAGGCIIRDTTKEIGNTIVYV